MDEQDEIFRNLLEFLEKNPVTLNVNPSFDLKQTLILMQAVSICRMREMLLIKYDLANDDAVKMYNNLSLNLSHLNTYCSLPVGISVPYPN